MSIHTTTIEELMQLTAPQLQLALRLFEQELSGTIDFLSKDAQARQDEPTLDDLGHLLTLRKTFRERLQELEAEETTLASGPMLTSAPMSERLFNPQLDLLPS